MKALMLGWEYPPHIAGGLGTACLALTRALALEGHALLFVVPQRYGDEDDAHLDLRGASDVSGVRRPGRSRTRRVPSELTPYARPEPADAPSAAGVRPARPYGPDLFAQVERYGDAVERIAAEEPADLVHAHDWMTFDAGRRAARVLACPLVLHVHSLEPDRAPRGPDPRITAAEQAGLNAADAVVCVSRFTAERVRRYYRVAPGRLCVVHNGLPDLGPSRPRSRAQRRFQEPLVLFLGRVTAQKGPEVLLEAARRVATEMPAVKFVVAGDGDMLRPMVERAAALGLARHVAFTGFLKPADVERAYAEADLFVLPSLAEPFGLTALEAAARGVPVVLSRQSGAAEVLPSARCVDWWDVEALAREILTLLRRPSLRARLARAQRREALARTWGAAASEVGRLWAALDGGAALHGPRAPGAAQPPESEGAVLEAVSPEAVPPEPVPLEPGA